MLLDLIIGFLCFKQFRLLIYVINLYLNLSWSGCNIEPVIARVVENNRRKDACILAFYVAVQETPDAI